MKECCLIPLFCLLMISLRSQVTEDFSDGNFTENPEWSGDTQSFIVNDDTTLQLSAGGAGTYCLYTSNSLCDSTEWIITARLKFSPSSNNNARIWLMTDSKNPETANGYFLQLGESGGEDVPELFCCENGNNTSVCRCSGPDISSSSLYTYRIIRTKYGFWNVGIINENSVYEECGAGFNDLFSETAWFGIECNCTSSNADNFYFDNILIRNTYYDTEPPEAWDAKPCGADKIQIFFSEPIDTETAQEVTNYRLSPGGQTPVGAGTSIADQSVIQLLFESSFINGEAYILEVSGIKDPAGNLSETAFLSFKYHKSVIGELVISEIMADINPVPPGLPPAEFLELYSRVDYPLSLEGYTLWINNREYRFDGSAAVDPGGFLLITDANTLEYPEAIRFENFTLPNSYADIVIGNTEDQAVAWLSYSDDMQDTEKRDGGWSLEIINPENPVSNDNMASSADPRGGTPGEQSSILHITSDITPPYITCCEVPVSDSIVLYTSEAVFTQSDPLVRSFSLTNSIIVTGATIESPGRKKITLSIAPPLASGVIAEVTYSGGLTDFSGNAMPAQTLFAALPQQPEKGDLRINEILFNPAEEMYDYAELYNTSEKAVSISSLAFAHYDSLTDAIYDKQDKLWPSMLLFPNEYLLITKDTAGFYRRYPGCGKIKAVTGSFLPTLPNEEGTLAVATFAGSAIIDAVCYNSAMHSGLLYSTEGVALERLADGSWHSSGELNNFGTPGYENSHIQQFPQSGGSLTVMPQVITPDCDGIDDIATIHIEAPAEYDVATVQIFDKKGYHIRTLHDNLHLAENNNLLWDGTTDSGSIVTAGFYIALVSFRNEKGRAEVKRALIGVSQ